MDTDTEIKVMENLYNLEQKPTIIISSHKLGILTKAQKIAVILNGKPVGETVLQGEGAGPGPTSSSLLSDLLSILRGNVKKPFGISSTKRKKVKVLNNKDYTNSLYLRFEVKDKSGVLSNITNRLAKYKISVKRIIQTPDRKNNKATIVIITHKTTEINSSKCLSVFKKNKNILQKPVLIRLYN